MAIYLIAAVGMSGQIGLNGKLPWQDDPAYREWMRQDLAMFSRMTTGGCLIMSPKTIQSLPLGFDKQDRDLFAYSRHSPTWGNKPAVLINYIKETRGKRDIWVCGGATVYEHFMPFVDECHISKSPYNGPADRWMPHLWSVQPWLG